MQYNPLKLARQACIVFCQTKFVLSAHHFSLYSPKNFRYRSISSLSAAIAFVISSFTNSACVSFFAAASATKSSQRSFEILNVRFVVKAVFGSPAAFAARCQPRCGDFDFAILAVETVNCGLPARGCGRRNRGRLSVLFWQTRFSRGGHFEPTAKVCVKFAWLVLRFRLPQAYANAIRRVRRICLTE